MAIQLSTAVRDARLDAIEAIVGPSPIIKILTGAKPANNAATETGTTLATLQLPADWMANASGGSKSMLGTWEDQSADAGGTAGYFRIYDQTGTACGVQGDISLTGGGGDLTVDNVVFAAGQRFTITSFTLTDGNA